VNSFCPVHEGPNRLWTITFADTLKREDFQPNILETHFIEPEEDGLLIKAQDLLAGALLNKQDIGTLTVDIFTVDISTPEPRQYNKFSINTQILQSSKLLYIQHYV
jgi:hypothetical protein